MSRENYPRDDGPDMLQFGLFLLLLAAIGLGVFSWIRAQNAVRLEQARAVEAAEAIAEQNRQSLLAGSGSSATGEASGAKAADLTGETADRREALEDEVKRLRIENESLRNELGQARAALTGEP